MTLAVDTHIHTLNDFIDITIQSIKRFGIIFFMYIYVIFLRSAVEKIFLIDDEFGEYNVPFEIHASTTGI